jgi:prepilin-type N-terminal cleavage/methylation domain-containing protein
MKYRAFTMIEVMIALALAGIVGAASVSVYALALRSSGDQGNEWQAVSIAQQQME